MHNREEWHLKKEFNVSHILTTISLALGLVVWGMNMDKRMTRIEVRMSTQHDVDLAQDRASSNLMASVNARLDRIEGKLDRLIESRR